MRRAIGLALVGLVGGFLLGLDLIVLGLADTGTSLIPACALIGLVFGGLLGWLLHVRAHHPHGPTGAEQPGPDDSGPIIIGQTARVQRTPRTMTTTPSTTPDSASNPD